MLRHGRTAVPQDTLYYVRSRTYPNAQAYAKTQMYRLGQTAYTLQTSSVAAAEMGTRMYTV